jgi:hypothetical protein
MRQVLRTNGGVHGVPVGHIYVIHFRPPLAQHFSDCFSQSIVHIVRSDDVVTRLQTLNNGVNRCHAGRKRQRFHAALHRREAFF